MNRHGLESALASIIVNNNWDLIRCPLSNSETVFEPRNHKYFGPSYATREKMKAEGWRMSDSQDAEEQLIGYGLVAYSHFYRSQESALDAGKQHPVFTEFMSHWLHSDPNLICEPARKRLLSLYPKPKKLKIGRGRSYWGTAPQQAHVSDRSFTTSSIPLQTNT